MKEDGPLERSVSIRLLALKAGAAQEKHHSVLVSGQDSLTSTTLCETEEDCPQSNSENQSTEGAGDLPHKQKGEFGDRSDFDTSITELEKEEEDRYTQRYTQNSEGNQQTQQSGDCDNDNAAQMDWSFLEQGQLFGREAEIDALQEAFQNHRRPTTAHGNNNYPRELVLVSGQSGTGKTALVKKALQDLTLENNGFFLFGKFDQQQGTSEPFAPFVAALTQLAISLEKRSCLIREQILEEVSMEACHVLCALAPYLGHVLCLENEQITLQTHDAQQDRLKVALIKLFQAISSVNRPVTIVIDDLQWADSASLNLLESIVAPNNNNTNTAIYHGLMVVGICRSNEVPWHHDFADMLRRLEDEKQTHITHVQVQNLTVETTTELLSNMLKQQPALCRPLAIIVHHKSDNGNVFFLLQLLKILQAEGVLVAAKAEREQSKQQHQWLWHDDRWDSLTMFQDDEFDVVDLVSNQILQMPKKSQELVKVAACLGAAFDGKIVRTVLDKTENEVIEAMEIAVNEGMIIEQLHSPGSYIFSHDRIQQAAYTLIPDAHRPMSHLIVGRTLLQQLSMEELKSNLFLVVNQLIQGIPLLTTEEDKHGLSKLCLQAGKKASQASDFQTALYYFHTGISLLPTRHWRDEYYLSLDLFCSKAEAQCCTAVFEEMDTTIDCVLTNCRTSRDRIRVYQTKIYSLSVRTEFQAALDLGVEVLAMLGEHFPRKPRLFHLIPEFIKIKHRLKTKSDDDILNLPQVEDQEKAIAMKVLNLMVLSAFCANPEFFPFLSLRWMKLTLKYGLCDISGLSFSCYSTLLCAVNEFEDAYRYVMLGKQIMDRGSSSRAQTLPRLYQMLYGGVAPWVEPMRSTFDGLELAIIGALDVGDYECSMFTSYNLMANSFSAGIELSLCKHQIEQYLPLMKSQRGPWLALTLLQQQVVDSLMGTSEISLHLEPNVKLSTISGTKFDFQMYNCMATASRLLVAYHFGDIGLAMTNAKASRGVGIALRGNYLVVIQLFYDCMTVMEDANNRTSRWRRRQARLWAQKGIKKLEKLGEIGPANILHKLYLLRGEVQALKGNLEGALEWYQNAATYAAGQKAIHLQALANERAAIATNRLGNRTTNHTTEANTLIRKAVDYYSQWGALGVVRHLKDKYNL